MSSSLSATKLSQTVANGDIDLGKQLSLPNSRSGASTKAFPAAEVTGQLSEIERLKRSNLGLGLSVSTELAPHLYAMKTTQMVSYIMQ